MKRTKTMKVGNADYSKVVERIKEFRQDCPFGLIETNPEFIGTKIMFKARILKDKSNLQSAEATGHAIGEDKGLKAFEKIESIAVGRALAMLGYAADGEIATGEEMEEFLDHKNTLKEVAIHDALEKLMECKTLDELKTTFVSLGSIMAEPEIIKTKDKLRDEFMSNLKSYENNTSGTE